MTTTILPVRVTDPIGSPSPTRPDADPPRIAPPAPRPASRGTGTSRTRTDIQALRAIAVSLVLVYHLWPNGLTGGFVGVDVFFVVSGFLITAHLLNRPPRTARDLAAFWARRIRRLLPAALLVLAATLLASRLLAPETQWANTARQAGAAALYVENWLLAGDSVDYLAAATAPTPVQHFWSLSVEEQFYLVWPLLIRLLAVVALRRGRPRAIMVGLLVVVVVSLAASRSCSPQSPGVGVLRDPHPGLGVRPGRAAGRVSPTGPHCRPIRGGSGSPTSVACLLAALGLGGITYAAVMFNASTPFPGWWALIPTLGTVAVIAASRPRRSDSSGRALALRPVQWLGDVSYSVYLWHWPLIVLVPFVVGGRLAWIDKLAIIVVTLLLAGLTKRFVEDRYRTPPVGSGIKHVFVAAMVGMILVPILAAVQIAEVGQRTAGARVNWMRRWRPATRASGPEPSSTPSAAPTSPSPASCPRPPTPPETRRPSIRTPTEGNATAGPTPRTSR